MYKYLTTTPSTYHRFKSILLILLSVGLFVQLSGKMWLPSGSSQAAQFNLWFIIPCVLLLLTNTSQIRATIKTKEELFILLFIIWFVVSALWSTSPRPDVFTRYIRYGLYIIVYLSGLTILYLEKPKYIVRAIDASMLVIATGALITFYTQLSGTETDFLYRNIRIYEMGIGQFGKFSGPIQSGNFFGACTVLAFGRLLSEKSRHQRILFFVYSLIFITYVILTGSRGSIVGVLFAATILLITSQSKLIKPALIISFALASFLIFSTSDFSYFNAESEQFRNLMDTLTNHRWYVWEKAISDVIHEHLIIGFGANAHMDYYNPTIDLHYYHPHSGFVLIAYQTGLIGLLLYFISNTSIIISGLKLLNRKLVKVAIGLLAFSFVAMLTDVHRIVTRPHEYWIFLWFPIGIILAAKRQHLETKQEA